MAMFSIDWGRTDSGFQMLNIHLGSLSALFSDRVSLTDREWFDRFDSKDHALSASEEGRAVQ
jgi:hypothetical protein